jgi:hypothetical protein
MKRYKPEPSPSTWSNHSSTSVTFSFDFSHLTASQFCSFECCKKWGQDGIHDAETRHTRSSRDASRRRMAERTRMTKNSGTRKVKSVSVAMAVVAPCQY